MLVRTADTGVASSTKAAVTAVDTALGADTTRARRLLARADAVIGSAADDLEAGRATSLGQRLVEFQELLAVLGVSTPGDRPTVGAARGRRRREAHRCGWGCLLALAATPAEANRVRAALHEGTGVSLTADPVEEIKAGQHILTSFGLRERAKARSASAARSSKPSPKNKRRGGPGQEVLMEVVGMSGLPEEKAAVVTRAVRNG